ncbi:hypothetical protein QSI_3904 [Clostridioides difficile P28]|nr:hypothetical protein QSI_3904 [Clostridioides difficile P28]
MDESSIARYGGHAFFLARSWHFISSFYVIIRQLFAYVNNNTENQLCCYFV